MREEVRTPHAIAGRGGGAGADADVTLFPDYRDTKSLTSGRSPKTRLGVTGDLYGGMGDGFSRRHLLALAAAAVHCHRIAWISAAVVQACPVYVDVEMLPGLGNITPVFTC